MEPRKSPNPFTMVTTVHAAECHVLSTKASQQSTLGYTHGSSLSVDRCASYEFDGDARHGQGFIQVRPPCGRNTYVLRLIILSCVELNCVELLCSSRGPLPLIYPEGTE